MMEPIGFEVDDDDSTITVPMIRREGQRDSSAPTRGRYHYYVLGLMTVVILRLIVTEEFFPTEKLLDPIPSSSGKQLPTMTTFPAVTESTDKPAKKPTQKPTDKPTNKPTLKPATKKPSLTPTTPRTSQPSIAPTPSYRKFCDASRVKPAMSYRCEGPKYDSFVQNLRDYVDTGDSPIPDRYGRSRFPFPSGSNILFFGNSHTRQLGFTLQCQYIDRITRIEYQLMPAGIRTDTMLTVFDNNSTVVSLTNIPIPYSPEWYKLFGKATGGRYELSDFDVIVLGMFNGYSNSASTNFAKTIAAAADVMNVSNIDFIHNEPPGLKAVTDHFSGPIVTVPMFADYGKWFAESSKKTVSFLETRHNRTNLQVIATRKHIEAMGQECGSDVKREIADCNTGGRPPEGMHRCIGAKGGHVDLIAWEVADKVNQLLA